MGSPGRAAAGVLASAAAVLVLAPLLACAPTAAREPDRDAAVIRSEDGALDDAARDDAAATGDPAAEAARDGAASQIDAGPGPDAAPPQCSGPADCGSGRGCLAGLCRDQCLLGRCDLASSGRSCKAGLCVQCLSDGDCASGRKRCDQASATCVDRSIDPTRARIGIFYSTWHCIAALERPVHDLAKVLAGQQSYGAYGVFHYWGQPSAGYYCPSQNDAVLRQHAEQLRDAGLDFVFIDATNHAYVDARSHDTPGMILRPLDRLLAVWSTVPRAPRLVPWVPVVEAGVSASTYTVDAMLQRIAAYPGMHFSYLGKPLVLITENAQYPVNSAREAALATQYTVRRMWGMLPDGGSTWSFMQPCKASPTSAEPCQQRIASGPAGSPAGEQLTVSAAYQQTFMNVASATPKHRGLTFRKQFQRALDWPETPIITLTGWNEWIAQRQQCGHPACPCASYPDGCFIDQWDMEYSRDIEPGANQMGTYYYRLMAACIALLRTGAQCDAAHAGDLCCRAWAP